MIKKYLTSTVAKNAASLYLIHFANYLLPLITVPYVVRVLTPFGYGLVSFGQSFIAYFSIFIDFGFNFSITRKISVSRHDQAMISRIAFSVWTAKLLLFLLGFLALLFLIHLVPTLRDNRLLLLVLYGAALGQVLFPTWLFQGLERMVYISVINLSIRLLVVVGIFTLIKQPEDYLLYAGLNSLGSFLAGVVGIVWAIRLFTLKPIIPTYGEIWETFKEGWMLFLSKTSVSLYTVGNSFILGMLTTPTVVGYYSAGEKIMTSILSLIGPISQAAYPHFAKMAADSKALALQWARRMLFLNGAIGLFISFLLIIGAPLIVNVILGKQFSPSINVIRILGFIPIFVAIGNVLGIQIMVPFRKDFLYASIHIIAGLINLSLAFLLIPLWQEIGMATAVLFSEFIVTSSMFAVLTIHNMNPIINNWEKA
jgi:PST family polysaccharide transporter